MPASNQNDRLTIQLNGIILVWRQQSTPLVVPVFRGSKGPEYSAITREQFVDHEISRYR